MDGILIVNKPVGWTSHDIVAVCRRQAGRARTGHGGTLDPLASGVLPILFGSATKFVERLHTASKVYGADILFGSETATDDREGAVLRHAPVPTLTPDDLEAALDAFRGEISQVPPDHSAVKVGGRTAYARARAGEQLSLASRQVRIERFDPALWYPPSLRCVIVCSSGTYIRSLARDLGRALGTAAHLAGLVRLAVGALELDSATSMDAIRDASVDELASRLVPADDAVLSLAGRFVSTPADRLLAAWEA